MSFEEEEEEEVILSRHFSPLFLRSPLSSKASCVLFFRLRENDDLKETTTTTTKSFGVVVDTNRFRVCATSSVFAF